MEDRLWDYIDGQCSPTERSAIEELLATNREWQQKHRELLNLQQLLSSSELEAPSMRFTKNVMEEIAPSRHSRFSPGRPCKNTRRHAVEISGVVQGKAPSRG